MTDYSAPLADMRFVLENIVDLPALASLSGFEHADPDMVDGVLEESGRFFAQEFGPLNRVGDTQHSRRNEDGTVSTTSTRAGPACRSRPTTAGVSSRGWWRRRCRR
jgi:hypothetical protein